MNGRPEGQDIGLHLQQPPRTSISLPDASQHSTHSLPLSSPSAVLVLDSSELGTGLLGGSEGSGGGVWGSLASVSGDGLEGGGKGAVDDTEEGGSDAGLGD